MSKTKWRVDKEEYFGQYWNEYDTYGSKKVAKEQFDRLETARLVKIEETVVDKKGKLTSNKSNEI